MTNYEKYKDLVIRCIAQDSICDLAYKAYGDNLCNNSCDRRTCMECCEFVAEWINREYPEIDWSEVEPDTPVLIKTEDGLVFRHFAKYWHGHVFVYANGQTSWTNGGETETWDPDYVEFRRVEDFKKYAKQ